METCQTRLCAQWVEADGRSTALATHVNHWPRKHPRGSILSMVVCAECVERIRVRSAGSYAWDRYLPILRFECGSEGWISLEAAFVTLAGLRGDAWWTEQRAEDRLPEWARA